MEHKMKKFVVVWRFVGSERGAEMFLATVVESEKSKMEQSAWAELAYMAWGAERGYEPEDVAEDWLAYSDEDWDIIAVVAGDKVIYDSENGNTDVELSD